ncbi:MAG TPA: hypothetical protein VFI28_12445 [Candidatus Limnocylindrales bacterium]|nr:hypothetical protein [Candidatus Limnocylindrales bacterium]
MADELHARLPGVPPMAADPTGTRREASSAESDDELTTLPLDVRRTVSRTIDPRATRAAFDDLDWLGTPASEPGLPAGRRRVRTDLDYVVPSGTMTVSRGALVDIGAVTIDGRTVRVEVAWRSASLAPLFPVFAGELVVSDDALALHGRYAPPFGRFGVVIDRALLHLVARGTGRAFLDRIADRLGGPGAGASPAREV